MNCTHEYEGRRCPECGTIRLSPDVEASHRAQDAFFRRVYRTTQNKAAREDHPREPRPVVDKDGNRI